MEVEKKVKKTEVFIDGKKTEKTEIFRNGKKAVTIHGKLDLDLIANFFFKIKHKL